MLNLRCANNKLEYEGLTFETKNNGSLIILEYRNYEDVLVKFVDTGYETVTYMSCILNGKVKDKFKPSVYGVGVIGDEVCTTNSGKTKEYKLWSSMLQRCYDGALKQIYPSYQDCTTSESFNYLWKFKEWCVDQIGFNSKDNNGKDFALDKDILIKGNKIYSEDTCCFVPYEINNLLSSNRKSRGDTPIGVSFHTRDNKYQAYLNTGISRVSLGYFISMTKAFQAYKEAKEQYIKEVANRWKDQIDPRDYEALMNYQVEITD